MKDISVMKWIAVWVLVCMNLGCVLTPVFETESKQSVKEEPAAESEGKEFGSTSRKAGEAGYETELDRALQRLVDDLELAVLGSDYSAGDDGEFENTYIVKSGEYLDLIIEKTMPNSPIKEDLLRRAFVQLNPDAFGGGGNPNYLFARQKLKIPSVEDLKTIIFKKQEMEKLKQTSRDPYRGWIRYP